MDWRATLPFDGNGELEKTLSVAPSWWVGRGCHWRVLFSFVYWPRKKLISQLIQFILFFYYDPTQLLQNWLNCPPLTPSPQVDHAHFWLAVAFSFVVWWPSKATTDLMFLFFFDKFAVPNDAKTPPDTCCHGHMPTPYPPHRECHLLVGCCLNWKMVAT